MRNAVADLQAVLADEAAIDLVDCGPEGEGLTAAVGGVRVETRESDSGGQQSWLLRFETCQVLVEPHRLPEPPRVDWAVRVRRYGEVPWTVERIESGGTSLVTLHLTRPLRRRSERSGATRRRP